MTVFAGRAALHALVVGLALVFALPFVWMLTTSLKAEWQVFSVPPTWIPDPVLLDNYPRALGTMNFLLYLKNTLVIACGAVVGVLLSCTLTAYGFSRISWPGRDWLFSLCVASMMIPFQVTMVPLFITFSLLGWVGTPLPLIVPAFFGVPYYIFLLRQFFLTIPRELSEAATIDGCSELGIFGRVVLPLASPALAVVALFQFIHAWSDYLGPLIYLNKQAQYTIALGLALFNSQNNYQFALLMAASAVTLAPVIVLFFLAQRTFIEGISLTGIKG
ncbi:MAG TPA: carbohydrate ABC transporter permease [Chloroflexota bacterium]|nr:carbohydrate ABC transporter permease [Chloroflexota bacterium]